LIHLWFFKLAEADRSSSSKTVKKILAGYLKTAPEKIRFRYGKNGKPYLAAPFAKKRFFFNLSHSHGRGLLAVTRGRRVGVDLEKNRVIPKAEKIAARFSFPKKVNFLKSWTAKEARQKAEGKKLLSLPAKSGRWTLIPINRIHGFTASLCVEGKEKKYSFFKGRF
jgi:4'-phosphopantetheinyl transferase